MQFFFTIIWNADSENVIKNSDSVSAWIAEGWCGTQANKKIRQILQIWAEWAASVSWDRAEISGVQADTEFLITFSESA